MSKTFSADEMDQYLYGPHVSREFVEKRRWYLVYRIVFESDGRLYSTLEHEPATEIQEGIEPFPDADIDGNVECQEVEPYEVTVTRYRKVGDKS